MMSGGGARPRGLLLSGRFPELEDALCERVAELREGGRLEPLTVVVGSSALRTRVGDLLVRRLGGVANVRVVTLARLAADLVAGARGAPPAVLAGLARERLLRRLVADRAIAGLGYFGPVADRPHFAQALAATFTDLREALVDPDTRWAAAAAVTDLVAGGAPAASRAGAKAADLQALYASYCEAMGGLGLMDAADVHVAAAAVVEAAPPRAVVFGIYDLNQAQEQLVGALLAGGADAFLPVPRDGPHAGVTVLDAALARGLAERRLDPPAESVDLGRVSAVWRTRGAGASAALPLAGDGTLRVVSVPDERAELREAVRAVVAAAAAGAALWDCAVVVPHGDDVERVAAGLAAAGLPAACRRPDRSLGPRVLQRLADCLAPPAGVPFGRRAVIDLLAVAALRDVKMQAGLTALWLDEAREAGVVGGLDQWVERMGRRRRGLERRIAELEALGADAADDEDGERLGTMRRRRAATRGLEAGVRALARACGGLPPRAPWDRWAVALGGVVAAVFENGAAQAAGDAAARLASLAPLDESVDAAEAAGVLRELLMAARVPEGRVGRDGVAVLTPLELRGLRFHSVVFTGLAEGGFPPRGRPDPILGDTERRRLGERTGARLPLAEQRDAETTVEFAFACEAARERLTLLAPRTDAATGRPRLPSRLLLRLASLAAGRPVGLDEFVSGAPLARVWSHIGGARPPSDGAVWVDRRERDTATLLALSEGGGRSAAAAYLAAVLDDGAAASRRLGAWRAARSPQPGPWDGLLGSAARAVLAARHPFDAEMHPTRLERYVGCPFAFLLRDVLGLDAPDEPGDALEMEGRDYGTLAHGILQHAYQRVIDDELTLDGALAAVADAWEAGCAEAEARGVTGAQLSWEVRRRILLDDLLECVRRDPVFAPGDGRPVGVEWRFGESAGRPVALDLGSGRRVRFAGRVDRVDTTASGARVIDYKTGAGGAERERIKAGLSVQLPVYRLAVRQAGEADYASVACLYRLVSRRGGFAELPLPADEAAAEERLRGLVAAAVALVDHGMFPRTTRGRCEYCDVGYACGSSAWARARKRENPALEPVVRLQSPAPKEAAGDS